MTDEKPDPEELLQESKNQRRHTTESTSAGVQEDVDDEISPLGDEILEAYGAIEAGELSTQVQTRDEDLAAILEGLANQPLDLDRVVDAAADELGADVDDDPTKADAVRLLVRVGLRAVDGETLDAAREAKRERAVDSL